MKTIRGFNIFLLIVLLSCHVERATMEQGAEQYKAFNSTSQGNEAIDGISSNASDQSLSFEPRSLLFEDWNKHLEDRRFQSKIQGSGIRPRTRTEEPAAKRDMRRTAWYMDTNEDRDKDGYTERDRDTYEDTRKDVHAEDMRIVDRAMSTVPPENAVWDSLINRVTADGDSSQSVVFSQNEDDDDDDAEATRDEATMWLFDEATGVQDHQESSKPKSNSFQPNNFVPSDPSYLESGQDSQPIRRYSLNRRATSVSNISVSISKQGSRGTESSDLLRSSRNVQRQFQNDGEDDGSRTFESWDSGEAMTNNKETALRSNDELRSNDGVHHEVCRQLQCKNGGYCVRNHLGDGVRCRCQIGTAGDRCERSLVVRYPRLLGNGFVAFPPLSTGFKEFQVTVYFRPETPNGLIVLSADQPDADQDFFSLALLNGRADFRFDCGSGRGHLRSSNSIELNQWNTIRVHRTGWHGWLQLNDGPEVKGRSKGSLTKIGMRGDLFLGGYSNLTAVGRRTGMSWGFVGCISKLVVNSKDYDMRRGAYVGDAIYGQDVGDCNEYVCEDIVCSNGGKCLATGPEESTCLCPLGFAGSSCQSKLEIIVPSFNGHSYLQYLGLRRTVLDVCKIEVVLKPRDGDGLVLYNGYSTDRLGDFIWIGLSDGYVEFRFNLGTGAATIRSRQKVTLNDWHTVRASRTGRIGVLSVDDQLPVEGTSQGAFTQLTLTLDLFLGGHRNYDETAKATDVCRSFKGCIQKVAINDRPLRLLDDAIGGMNIDNCNHPCVSQPCRNGGQCVPLRESYKCSCPNGYQNRDCQDSKLT